MTKLLVSVRDVAEAQMAIEEGVDLIDVKDPDRGSLGAADAATIGDIVRHVSGRVPLSVALGELAQGNQLPEALGGQIAFAKFGLAGCAPQHDWHARWEAAIARLPTGIAPVAVAYADWRIVDAPEPFEILERARSLACGALLLDTFAKGRDNLLSYYDLSELRTIVVATHRAHMLCVLAGSLGRREIEAVLPLKPDYVAVRGAACAGSRLTGLDRLQLRKLVKLVHHARVPHKGSVTSTL